MMDANLLILLISSIGAGILTGLLGASAVMVIGPIAIMFLKLAPYNAIGLALAIDVSASLVAAAYFYSKGRINMEKSLSLLLVVLAFSLVGSYFSQFFPSGSFSWAMGLGIMAMGIGFYNRKDRDFGKKKDTKFKHVFSAGALIGLVSGMFGAGGGMMMLFTLVFLLGYEMHEAIGTSVMLMVFIALFSAGAHYIYSPFSTTYLIIGSIGGMFGAYTTAIYVNRLNKTTLKKIAGVVLSILGAALFMNSFL